MPTKAYYLAHSEALKAYSRAYYVANAEELRADARERRTRVNPEVLADRQRAYVGRKRAEINERRRATYAAGLNARMAEDRAQRQAFTLTRANHGGSPWSPAELGALRHMVQANTPALEMALALGRTLYAVRARPS